MPESTFIGTLERVRRGRAGQDCQETKVASEPEALVAFFASIGFAVKRIGLEGGTVVGMAACGAEASRIRYCSAGDDRDQAMVCCQPPASRLHLLMSVTVLGAMAIGERFEAATVIFLFAVSLTLESWRRTSPPRHRSTARSCPANGARPTAPRIGSNCTRRREEARQPPHCLGRRTHPARRACY